MHHIILGAGPAGVIAAETLRKLDSDCEITLIGDETEPPYSRMAIPYFLVKQIPEKGTYLRKNPGHFENLRVRLVNDKVIRIEPDRNILALHSGNSLNYDRLLIATGSHPVFPNVAGIDQEGVMPCWTLEHARKIASRLRPGVKIVLMGAGFIGCIILEALAKSGAELTVIEMGDRMVPRMMNITAGNLIKHWCIGKNIDIRTSTRVTAIEPGLGAHKFSVILDSGDRILADLVVSATGVKPNIAFLAESGIATDAGILVDRGMRTNRPDVYAAGDVAQGLDFSTGGYSVQAIQPTASEHGQIAARNMAGKSSALHRGNLNMNVLDTLGLISSSFGLWMGVDGGEQAESLDSKSFQYINLQFQDDVLVGATTIGLTAHVGILRGLIQGKIRLGSWKDKLMRNPNLIMEAYLASTQTLN
ncbi:MAG: NAD(P)/FAD-dependent oxidoreductase [Gammaproteobacteria bacterium]